ncbi:MAG: hypothetical protein P0Y49_16890 [Candidatus Pedobacter colombiensis]|uniref:Uncharacterized protein n=1 Tax=Candidatus Pedobacter colombiensis TaxID=3121371 RepID=A0AAJ6B7W2_9SPHI|nr:hypothetical protein [Pedobacter sp.]WEK18468.1 MAG: hypothetical protein P0Y49_16890 [Pedobacter sp.]
MTEITFIIVTCLSVILFYLGTGKQNKGFLLYVGWILVVALLSWLGFFKNTTAMPPRILLVIVPAIIFVIYSFKKIQLIGLRRNYLIGIHILRIPVELVLFQLYIQGKIPVIMTFAGWNFDILMGISAALMLGWTIVTEMEVGQTRFRVWNIVGIVFLAIIVGIAILSAPSPIQQLAFDRPNLAILQFPYTLLPAIVVPLVLLSHLLCLKKIG